MKVWIPFIVFAAVLSCQTRYDPEINADEIRQTVRFLASDSLKGRRPGEEGDKQAAAYIRKKFENAGLDLLFENGFQEFKLVTSASLGASNHLSCTDRNFLVNEDYIPYSFSACGTFKAPLVFLGYGMEVSADSARWNDFEGIDVTGKWIMALQGSPQPDDSQSPFHAFSSERTKALKAADHHAAGLILVAGPAYSQDDELPPLFFDKSAGRYPIPVIRVKRSVAGYMLQGTGHTVETLEKAMQKKSGTVTVKTGKEVVARVEVGLQQVTSQNVVALLPGVDDSLREEYVVIGAHYDHLGMGGAGSGSRMPDTAAVHYGADDNASGVAALIELAEKLAGEGKNSRSVLFAAFGAEEMGLIGSKAFMDQPPVDPSQMVAMFNLDMVGRLDTASRALSIGGTGTAVESEEIIRRLNPGFKLALSGDGYGPSDHASFYMHSIPVFFISTGAHSDYHTPYDTPDKIDYGSTAKVTAYTWELVNEVVSRDSALTFQEAGSRFSSGRRERFKVTLGIMPDFAGLEERGLRVDAVSKDKPAEKGGMEKGDIITAINGKKVGNIYDYLSRLKELESGEIITVDVIRGEEKKVLIISL